MKKTEKNRKISARREFYANLEKIRDLYNNKGFKFAKELYEHLNFNMSLWSFNHYFNKEIKNKIFHPTSQIENLNSKKNEIIENNSQNINQSKKEQSNETNKTSTMTSEAYKAARERLERSMSYHEQGIQNYLKHRQELKEKEENENNSNS